MFLVLEKLCKNFKINIFLKILAQMNTSNSAEHCGRKNSNQFLLFKQCAE